MVPLENSCFTEVQIVIALKQAEPGKAVPDVCRKLDATGCSFHRQSTSESRHNGNKGAQIEQR